MKCVICGDEEAVWRGKGSRCLWNEISISVPGSLEYIKCPKCESVKVGKKWEYSNGDISWSENSKKLFTVSEPFKIENIEIERGHSDMAYYKMLVSLSGETREFQGKIHLTRQNISCPNCNKITGSYYEAKIQIRGITGGISDRIIEIKDQLLHSIESKKENSPESFISKVEVLKEGIDVYLGKKRDGESFVKDVSGREYSKTNTSNTLAGVKDGKKFYRFTYLLRVFDAPVGSIIEIEGKNYIYLGKMKGGLNLYDFNNDRNFFLRRNSIDLMEIKYTGNKAEERKMIVLSSNGDELELLDDKNFKRYTAHRWENAPEPGKMVNVFIYNESLCPEMI
ncbi:NMD3-related protein [Caldiplasma sukawensis]